MSPTSYQTAPPRVSDSSRALSEAGAPYSHENRTLSTRIPGRKARRLLDIPQRPQLLLRRPRGGGRLLPLVLGEPAGEGVAQRGVGAPLVLQHVLRLGGIGLEVVEARRGAGEVLDQLEMAV